MAEIVNGTCHAKKAPDGPPLIQHGNLVFQAHHVGWIITGTFTIISMITSFWLINKHLQWYTNKKEQRYIVRILFMVPIYSVVSFASYLFWNHSTPLLLLRDGYESTVLTSFFYLLLTYLSPHPEEQKAIFRKHGLSRENDREARKRGEQPTKWMFPLGFIKSKPKDGLYFLQMMKWGVLQYCVVRPTTTFAAVVLDYAGLYCEDSWSPRWGHVYITVLVSISVSVAMYCLLQLYFPVSKLLAVHKPILKLFAVKAVVFLTFWQATFLSFLTMFGVVKDTEFMTADNINIGIGAILETFEMTIFGFLHIKAFSYRPYKIPPDRTKRWRALVHAMNFAETFRELRNGMVYIFRRWKGHETDMQARRDAALEGVFGRSRFDIAQKQKNGVYDEKTQKSVAVSVDVDEMVHLGEERQWLGVGDNYAYGLKYQARKEKSDSLGRQIEKELESRGYGRRELSGSGGARYEAIGNLDLDPTPRRQSQRHSRGRQSWWRNAFSRISHSSNDQSRALDASESPALDVPPESRRHASRTRKSRPSSSSRERHDRNFDDPPPPSALRSYRSSRDRHGALPEDAPPSPTSYHVPPIFVPQPTAASFKSPPRRVQRKPPPEASPSPSGPQLLSPPASSPRPETPSERADSLLGRVFPLSDTSHATSEALVRIRLGPSSSHSHQSAVRLAGHSAVEITGTVVAQAPLMIQSDTSRIRSQERLVQMPHPHPQALPAIRTSPLIGSPPSMTQGSESARSSRKRSSHIRDSAHFESSSSPPSSSTAPTEYWDRSSRAPAARSSYPLDHHAARRERIVLPTRLAPVASSSSPARNSTRALQHDSLLFTSPTSLEPSGLPQPSSSSPPLLQPTRRLSSRHSMPSPAHAQMPHSVSHQTSLASPGSGPRHPALASPRSPGSGPNEAVQLPQLRRSTHNVKWHSYAQDQQRRASGERRSRRLSAPPEGSSIPPQTNGGSSLHPVAEGSTDRP